MSTDSNGSFHLLNAFKLKGAKNYVRWKSQIKILLESKKLEQYILFTKPDPITDVWKTNNAKAKMAIMVNVLDEPVELICDLDTAFEMWKILQSQYEGSGHNLKQSYLTELHLLRYKQFNSITAFVV